MPYYRIYLVNEKGHIVNAPRVIACDNDEEAIEQAKPLTSALLDGQFMELCDGGRAVGRVPNVLPSE